MVQVFHRDSAFLLRSMPPYNHTLYRELQVGSITATSHIQAKQARTVIKLKLSRPDYPSVKFLFGVMVCGLLVINPDISTAGTESSSVGRQSP